MREVIISFVVNLRCSNTSISSLIFFMTKECRMILPKPLPRPVGVYSKTTISIIESNIAVSGPTFRFIDGIARPGPSSSAVSHQDRATNHHTGLVKQAYSVWVMVRPNTPPQKWHLTAYFTYAELPHLPTIDRDPNLRTVIVPPGIYRSARRSRTDDDELSRGGTPVSSVSNPYVTPMLALPSLSTLHVTPPPAGPPTHIPYGTRLPEDERLIHMLNSRHVR